jgi:hypothetical protein
MRGVDGGGGVYFLDLEDDGGGGVGSDGAFAVSFCFIHHVTSSATSWYQLLLTWMRRCLF